LGKPGLTGDHAAAPIRPTLPRPAHCTRGPRGVGQVALPLVPHPATGHEPFRCSSLPSDRGRRQRTAADLLRRMAAWTSFAVDCPMASRTSTKMPLRSVAATRPSGRSRSRQHHLPGAQGLSRGDQRTSNHWGDQPGCEAISSVSGVSGHRPAGIADSRVPFITNANLTGNYDRCQHRARAAGPEQRRAGAHAGTPAGLDGPEVLVRAGEKPNRRPE
jgi:hypothetical protein